LGQVSALVFTWAVDVVVLVEQFESLFGLALAAEEQTLDLREAQSPIVCMDGF